MPKINVNELTTNAANGLAKLDGSAKLPTAQLPTTVPVANLPTNTASGVAGLDSSGVLSSTVLPYIKAPVRVATTAALASCTYSGGVLTASANGALASIDGVSLSVGERLLVKDQATGTQNGIYTVTSLGGAGSAWVLTRATDFNTSALAFAGAPIFVVSGTVNGATTYFLTTTGTITLDTTSLTFTKTSATSVAGGIVMANGSNGYKVQGGVASTSGSISFPITFNTLLAVTASMFGTSATGQFVQVKTVTVSGAGIDSYDYNGANTNPQSVYWIAIGT